MYKNVILLSYSVQRNLLRSYARKVQIKTKQSKPEINKFKTNPGIQKRLKIIGTDENELDDDDLDLENLESDFMNLRETDVEYDKEINFYKDKEKYWIVKRKCFKETKINFLTWSDKEQICYLHQSNPKEWTVEKLSQGFPALSETIMKVIKAKWSKGKETKITNHDQSVERNWKLLQHGKLNDTLPPDLLEHVLKFSSRQLKKHATNDKTVINTVKPRIGRFESIIESYESLKQKTNKAEINNEPDQLKSKKLIGNLERTKIDRKPVTLDKLKENINKSIEIGKFTNKEDEIIVKAQETTTSLELHDINNIIKYKQDLKTEIIRKDPEKTQEVISYPEKIRIPKGKFKKGYTYKLNDCFYDDDGEFLYRVPSLY